MAMEEPEFSEATFCSLAPEMSSHKAHISALGVARESEHIWLELFLISFEKLQAIMTIMA